MLPKVFKYLMILLVAASLLSSSVFPTHRKAQASTGETIWGTNTPATAIGLIYNQPVDPNGKILQSSWLDPDGSDNDKYAWDNFTLQTSESITEIKWYGGYDPLKFGAGGPVLGFSINIYPSIAAGTEPNVANPPLVHYQSGGSAGETSIGDVGGIQMYAYTFGLPAPFSTSAGVKYWVQIEAFQQGSIPDWGFAAATSGDGSYYLRESGAGGDIRYHFAPGDAAFTLLGPTPDPPTNIYLSNQTIDENQAINTIVGSLSATDPDPAATFTFNLACTIPGVDDSSFKISGSNLQTAASFDYETKNSYDICIRVTNQSLQSFDKNFIINVNNVNEAPTGISLTGSTIDENQPVNTLVGTLSATDPDTGAVLNFSLTCTSAGIDDSSFNIQGTNLRSSATFDFETRTTYNICVRVTDQGDLPFDQDFIIIVNNLIEAQSVIYLPSVFK